MKKSYIIKYNSFLKRKMKNISEKNSEKKENDELLKNYTENEKNKIENIIKKHFNYNIDLDNIINKDEKDEDINKQENSEKEDKIEEGVLLTTITITSLIPAIMEAVGKFSNFLKINFGINLTDDDLKQIRHINDAITAYYNILKKGKAKYNNIIIDKNEWKTINSELYKLTKIELLKNENTDSENVQTKKNENSDEKIKEEIKKLKNIRDEIFGTSFSSWLKENAHKIHSLYVKPIDLLLLGLSKIVKKESKLKNVEFRKKIANIIYSITMLSIAGLGILESLSHLEGVKEVSNILIKGIEGGLNTNELRKQCIAHIIKNL